MATAAQAPEDPKRTRKDIDKLLAELAEEGKVADVILTALNFEVTMPAIPVSPVFAGFVALSHLALGDLQGTRFALRRYAHISDPLLTKLTNVIKLLWSEEKMGQAVGMLQSISGPCAGLGQTAAYAIIYRALREYVVSYKVCTLKDVITATEQTENDIRETLKHQEKWLQLEDQCITLNQHCGKRFAGSDDARNGGNPFINVHIALRADGVLSFAPRPSVAKTARDNNAVMARVQKSSAALSQAYDRGLDEYAVAEEEKEMELAKQRSLFAMGGMAGGMGRF